MEQEKLNARREFIAKIADYTIGFTVLAKGWEEAEHFGHFPFRVVLIFLAGAFIIAGTSLSRFFEKRIRNFPGIFHLLEGIVEILVATILLQRGRRWIPVFLAFVGLIYLSIGLAQLLAGEGRQQEALRRLRRFLAVAFIVFGAAMAAFNALTELKIAVTLCCMLLVGMGVFLLRSAGASPLRRPRLGAWLYDRLHRRE